MQNAFPSKDPANDEVAGAFEEIYRKLAMDDWGQLPARVIQYDRTRNVVQCLPLIAVWHTDGTTTQRADIAEVPVLSLGGGGVNLTFDLQPGDLGWIEASARDISLFMQTLDVSRPATVRFHALEDSRFIPDAFRRYTLAAEAPGHAVLQSTDGDTYIAIKSGHVSITTGGTLDAKAETINATASVINADAPEINVTGYVKITGGLSVNGIDFSTHTHTSTAPGDPTSEPNAQ